jgi:predicted AAA+ superfamily ATPase
LIIKLFIDPAPASASMRFDENKQFDACYHQARSLLCGRTTPEIFYFKAKSGREVDFVVQKQDRSCTLVQVCGSTVDPHTHKREITALSEAMLSLNCRKAPS